MNRSLTIFQVASHARLERGGAIQMFRLACGLRERGHRVICMMNSVSADHGRSQQAKRRFEEAGLDLHFFAMNRIPEMFRFRRMVREMQPQVIHVHREDALRFVYLSTMGMNVPCLVTNRGTTYPPKWRTLERLLIRSKKLRKVIAVAEAVKESLLSQVPLDPEKIDVVYGGVDLNEFDFRRDGKQVRNTLNIAGDCPLVVHVGSLVKKKGVEHLLSGFATLLKSHPTARLILVGDGSKRKVKQFLRDNHLEHAVFVAGMQADVVPFLAAADIVVCAATQGEGLTGSIREALAMKCPVVCTAVSGNPEMVRHTQTGLLVPAGDAEAISQAIAYLIDHPDEAKAMGEAGFAWVKANCDEAIRSAKVEDLYYRVLGRHVSD